MPVSVKICGLSDKKAVEAAIASGADYVGFVYFPASPRHITFERAAELKALLPPAIHSVCVMVDPDDALLEQAQSILNSDYVQLHGNETPQRVKDIGKKFPAVRIIKAISVKSAEDIEQAENYYDCAELLMFDAKVPLPPLPEGEGNYLPGGNAVSFDWALLKGCEFPLPWFLSGGLTPENVTEAIRISGAKMVDVSSGVESNRGVKDPLLIQHFIKQAKQAG